MNRKVSAAEPNFRYKFYLQAEYERLSIIEADLAIKRRQLELEVEDLKKHEA